METILEDYAVVVRDRPDLNNYPVGKQHTHMHAISCGYLPLLEQYSFFKNSGGIRFNQRIPPQTDSRYLPNYLFE